MDRDLDSEVQNSISIGIKIVEGHKVFPPNKLSMLPKVRSPRWRHLHA